MTKKSIQIASCNLFGMILLLSQYYTYRHGFWFNLDTTLFHYFNQFLDGSHRTWLYFIAITNHRLFDIVSFLAMATLYYSYFRKQHSQAKRYMIAIGLMMLIMAICMKQLGSLIPISHQSPTLYFEHIESVNRISQLTHFGTKDASADSFPSDHGMMLIIFAAFMWRYFGLTAFIQSSIIVIIFPPLVLLQVDTGLPIFMLAVSLSPLLCLAGF